MLADRTAISIANSETGQAATTRGMPRGVLPPARLGGTVVVVAGEQDLELHAGSGLEGHPQLLVGVPGVERTAVAAADAVARGLAVAKLYVLTASTMSRCPLQRFSPGRCLTQGERYAYGSGRLLSS